MTFLPVSEATPAPNITNPIFQELKYQKYFTMHDTFNHGLQFTSPQGYHCSMVQNDLHDNQIYITCWGQHILGNTTKNQIFLTVGQLAVEHISNNKKADYISSTPIAKLLTVQKINLNDYGDNVTFSENSQDWIQTPYTPSDFPLAPAGSKLRGASIAEDDVHIPATCKFTITTTMCTINYTDTNLVGFTLGPTGCTSFLQPTPMPPRRRPYSINPQDPFYTDKLCPLKN